MTFDPPKLFVDGHEFPCQVDFDLVRQRHQYTLEPTFIPFTTSMSFVTEIDSYDAFSDAMRMLSEPHLPVAINGVDAFVFQWAQSESTVHLGFRPCCGQWWRLVNALRRTPADNAWVRREHQRRLDRVKRARLRREVKRR